jgi:hypothetical protein
VDATLALECRPWEHFSLGAGLNSVRMRLEGDEDTDVPGMDFAGDCDVSFAGLLLYGKILFQLRARPVPAALVTPRSRFSLR